MLNQGMIMNNAANSWQNCYDANRMPSQQDMSARFNAAGQAQFQPRTLVAIADDPRIAQLVAFYHGLDERGRLTLLRMAQVMPRAPVTL